MDTFQLVWSNMVIGLAVSVIGVAQLLIILAIGLREPLNRAFGLLVAVASAIGLCFGLSHAILLRASASQPTEASLQNASSFLGLAAAGIFLLGPALLLYAVAFTATSDTDTQTPDIKASKLQTYKALAVIAIAVGVALVPVFLNDRAIIHPYLAQDGSLAWSLTRLGYIVFSGPFLLALLALKMFWHLRHRAGGSALTAGIAVWLVGSVGSLHGDLSVGGLTLGTLVLAVGYVTINIQVLNPLEALRAAEKASVANRTRELQQERDKLQRLYDQQRRIGDIGIELTQLHDPSQAATRLVELIHNSLGYHHVYVYLPDEESKALVVCAAAGTTARTVLENGHQLRIGGPSVAAQAAAEQVPRIAEAADENAALFIETPLPGARSEMALPITAGNELLGVLDLQSIHYGAFTQQDLDQMSSLASTAAAAMISTQRLFHAKEVMLEAERNQKRFLDIAWKPGLDNARTDLAYEYTIGHGVSVAAPQDREAFEPKSGIDVANPINPGVEGALIRKNEADSGEIVVMIPVRGRPVGSLTLRHQSGRAWEPDDVKTLVDVAERTGFALETARLFEESQQNVAREQLISRVSGRIHETLSVETMLKTAAREVREALQLSEVVVRLGDEPRITLAGSTSTPKESPPRSYSQEHLE